MSSLRNLFKNYTGYLRGLKVVYFINNLFNRNKLVHNKALYEKLGIKRSIFSGIGKHTFKEVEQLSSKIVGIPWLDEANGKDQLLAHPEFQSMNKDWQDQLINFVDNGFMILKGFYNDTEVETLNEEVDKLLSSQKTDFNFTGKKIMDAFRSSELINKNYFRNTRLLNLLNFVMGKNIVPFQTINFIQGSEQLAHSDSIHMTSEPLGYLVATWTALEDTNETNGPLFYYPGTHKLPYVTCQDYQSGNTKWQLGKNTYQKYEDKIAAIINEQQLRKEYFYASKGDVFIWHANLLHGGSAITKKGATRKSMVAHYFCEGVICYHELLQRPALLELE